MTALEELGVGNADADGVDPARAGVQFRGQPFGQLAMSLPGLHNAYNALAADHHSRR